MLVEEVEVVYVLKRNLLPLPLVSASCSVTLTRHRNLFRGKTKTLAGFLPISYARELKMLHT